MTSFLFSSESVGEGHPDKVADQISDAVLDAYLEGDSKSRSACETLVKNNTILIAGEISSKVKVDLRDVALKTIKDIGYTDPEIGFDASSCEVILMITEQSNDISIGVTEGEGTYKEPGAGDQGLMFGYACDETPDLMPLPIDLSHKLVHQLSSVRKSGKAPFLRPDAKAQVSVQYENNKPIGVNTVVVSTQHTEEVDLKDLQTFVKESIIKECIPAKMLNEETKYYINPTGRFVIGGPVGDCGLTGRKIIVDTYGGTGRHGGGAFSGKDPTKVDRSASYMARYIAKNIVAAGLAKKCEVQLAYAIGVAEPVSVYVNTFGTETRSLEKLPQVVRDVFELTPKGIIQQLKLDRAIYLPTAAYGHFGRTPTEQGHFSWERSDKSNQILSLLG